MEVISPRRLIAIENYHVPTYLVAVAFRWIVDKIAARAATRSLERQRPNDMLGDCVYGARATTRGNRSLDVKRASVFLQCRILPSKHVSTLAIINSYKLYYH